MPGRGRGLMNVQDDLRRPGPINNAEGPVISSSSQEPVISSSIQEPVISSSSPTPIEGLVDRIASLTSPDDLAVSSLANEIKTLVLEESPLSDFIDKLFARGLEQRDLTPVIGAICGLAAQHQVNETKLQSLVLLKLQHIYEKREELEANDRKQFVTSTMFIGEIFYRCRFPTGAPIKVLSFPVVTCLLMVLKPHLTPDPGSEIDDEMMAVAKQLLQNGSSLYRYHPHELEDVVKGVTEILIRHKLSDLCRLNLLAALSDMWPIIYKSLNARTTHATLAAKLGLVLQI